VATDLIRNLDWQILIDLFS